jgi:hypothetical protein
VKNLKILILLCGGALLGIYISLGLDFEENKVDTLIFLAAYALPTVMGLMGLAKPPFQSWQGAIALAGFGVAAVRGKIWEQLPRFADVDGRDKAGLALLVVGIIVSVVAIARPEDSA